jgi:hypothetical protein
LFNSALGLRKLALEQQRPYALTSEKDMNVNLMCMLLAMVGQSERAFELLLLEMEFNKGAAPRGWVAIEVLRHLVEEFRKGNSEAVWRLCSLIFDLPPELVLGAALASERLAQSAMATITSEDYHQRMLDVFATSVEIREGLESGEEGAASILALFVCVTTMRGYETLADQALDFIQANSNRQALLNAYLIIAVWFVLVKDVRRQLFLNKIKQILAQVPATAWLKADQIDDEDVTADNTDELETPGINIKDFPDNIFIILIKTMLMTDDTAEITALLKPIPTIKVMDIIGKILSDYVPVHIEDGEADLGQDVNDKLSESLRLLMYGLIPKYLAIRKSVIDSTISYLRQRLESGRVEGCDSELVDIARTLLQNQYEDDARFVIGYITNETKRQRFLKGLVAHGSEPLPDELVPDDVGSSVSMDVGEDYTTIIELQNRERFADAAALARTLSSTKDQLHFLRSIAFQMAQADADGAEALFNEAIQLARSSTGSMTAKLTGRRLRQIAYSAAASANMETLAQYLDSQRTRPNGNRDALLCGVIDYFLSVGRIDDAEIIFSHIKVDPWLREAQTALINALTTSGDIDVAERYVQNSVGRINHFVAICTYAAALGKAGAGHADTLLAAAEQSISGFRRSLHHSWAMRTWAFALVKLEHPQAKSAMDEAIAATIAVTDMLTRFEGLSELLDVLLPLEDPRAASVYHQLVSIFTEASYPKYNAFLQQTDQQHWWSAAIAMPVWEINACLELARILRKHGRGHEAADMIRKAEIYQNRLPPRAGSYALDITNAIADATRLKERIEALGSRSLSDLLMLMSAWEDTFEQMEPGLSKQVNGDMLRLFRWVGHDLTQIGDLLKSTGRQA